MDMTTLVATLHEMLHVIQSDPNRAGWREAISDLWKKLVDILGNEAWGALDHKWHNLDNKVVRRALEKLWSVLREEGEFWFWRNPVRAEDVLTETLAVLSPNRGGRPANTQKDKVCELVDRLRTQTPKMQWKDVMSEVKKQFGFELQVQTLQRYYRDWKNMHK
jgi:hypothetical protein